MPFSIELRKVLFRLNQVRQRTGVRSDLMFAAQFERDRVIERVKAGLARARARGHG